MSCPNDTTIFEFVTGGLRGDQLASTDAHVDSCPDCRDLVLGLAQGLSSSDSADDAQPELAETFADLGGAEADGLPAGSLFGRYVVLRRIGEGGMGAVYLAFDAELNRKVALKLLRTDAAPHQAELTRERLMREAQAMARLSHPNVVAVYEVGAVDDAVFLAMEYVEGTTLKEWMDDDHDWREVVNTFTAAANGLRAAHDVDLVHRDFKPANVLVGDDGRVRVTDFGLARDAAGDTSVDNASDSGGGDASGDRLAQTLTMTGSMIGTPAYMAPEQFAGTPAGALADQFSFCATMYEALYGKRAFTGKTIAELAENVKSAASLAQPKRSVPTWLHALLVRGMSAKPDDRFDSMDAVVAELVRDRGRVRRLGLLALAIVAPVAITAGVLMSRTDKAGAPVCTASAQTMAKVWNDSRKSAVASALGAADRSYSGAYTSRVTGELDRWSKRWVVMHQQTCRATRVDGNQSEALLDARTMCLSRQRDRFAALVTQLQGGDKQTASRATAALNALPDIDACADVTSLTAVSPPPAAVRATTAGLYRQLATARALLVTGKLDQADTAARSILGRAKAAAYKPLIAEATLVVAELWLARGKAHEAERTAYQGLWAAQESRADRGVAEAWSLLVRIAGESAQYERAAQLTKHASASVVRLGSPPALAARLRVQLGLVAFNRGRYTEARKHLRTALELRKNLHGDRHHQVAAVLTNLGHVARRLSDYPLALRLHRQALATDRQTFGDAHPRIARHNHNIGGILRLQNKLAKALEHYKAALSLRKRLLGADHHQTALTHNSIGLVLLDTDDLPGAKRAFSTASEIFGASKHGGRAMALFNMGRTLQRQGKHKRAVYALDEALRGYGRAHGESHFRVAEVRIALGESHAALGNRKAAQIAFQRVLSQVDDRTIPRTVIERARTGLRKLGKLSATPRPTRPPTKTATAPPPLGPRTGPTSVSTPPKPIRGITPPKPPTPKPGPGRRDRGTYGGSQSWQ